MARTCIPCIILGLFLVQSIVESAQNVQVSTRSGVIMGRKYSLPYNVHGVEFKSIPYAEKPVGDLAFRAPKPISDWTNTKDVTMTPPPCWQATSTNWQDLRRFDIWSASTGMSEDCLYLSIAVPNTDTKNLPTMFWIHGDGYLATGTSALDIYDYKTLASEQDLIVVKVQYRLGPFGFLYLGNDKAPGNMGLLDQLEALKWVKSNIDVFGGNPNKITLAGNLGGGFSVGYHLMSPMSKNLFSYAIIESLTSYTSKSNSLTTTNAIKVGLNLAVKLNCTNDQNNTMVATDCIRQKSASEIAEVISFAKNFEYSPVVDGKFIIDNITEVMRKGSFKRTSVLLGKNLNEANLYMMRYYPEFFPPENNTGLSTDQLQKYSRGLHPSVIEEISKYYWKNSSDPLVLRDELLESNDDFAFKCPMTKFADSYSKISGATVFKYVNVHRSSNSPLPSFAKTTGFDTDILTFGHPLSQPQKFTSAEGTLSRKIMTFWGNFARSGDPNIKGDKTVWPRYMWNDQKHLNLDIPMSQGSFAQKSQCDFWENKFGDLVKEGRKKLEAEKLAAKAAGK